MRKKIRAYMEEYHMTEPGDVVLCGLSGGADSVCLFLVLYELQKEMNYTLQAVHVHHNLRGEEADRDAAFAKGLCAERHVPFYFYSRPVAVIAKERGMSVEEAGRAARQEVFAECMEKHGATKLALAHHQNDLAETMLHHLARGTSLAGLAPIRPVRGCVIRPLLAVGREEIEAELKKRNLSWCEDSTNAGDDYTRNQIRHHIIPYLSGQLNPRAVQHMARASMDILEAEVYLEQQADRAYERHVSRSKEDLRIAEPFREEPEILQRYVIRKCLWQLAGKRKDLSREHLETVQRLFGMQVGKRVFLPYGIRAQREYSGVRLAPAPKEGTLEFRKKRGAEANQNTERKAELVINPEKDGNYIFGSYQVSVTVAKVQEGREEGGFFTEHLNSPENQERFSQKKYTKCLDCDKIKNSLVLRTRKSGDYLVVHADGGRKKLKDYMIDRKIPRSERDAVPVLAVESEILWVVGYRLSEAYRVTNTSRRILQIEITGGITNE